jgi:DNA modification methylase
LWDEKYIWKEPLRVAIRSRARALMHQQIVNDASMTRGALADILIFFKKKGESQVPVTNEYGLKDYIGDLDLLPAGEREKYEALKEKYKNFTGSQLENKYSQWIWQHYASSVMLINAKRMLEYRDAKEEEDERHVCPLHLDIIERSIILYTNPGEVVFTPFMGIGSEVAGALNLDRRGIGIELKESYFLLAHKNIERMLVQKLSKKGQRTLFGEMKE